MKTRSARGINTFSFYLMLCLVFAFLFCGATTYAAPNKSEFVTDKADMLSHEDEVTIEAVLNEIYEQSGVEYAVYISPSLNGDSIENASLNEFRSLGLGNKEKNNGLLLYIAKEDRQFRLEVGYGLEGVITDTQASKIINCITPYFRSEDYCSGILAAITKTVETLNSSEEYSIEQSEDYIVSEQTEESGVRVLFYGFVILIIIIIVICLIADESCYGSGGGSDGFHFYGGSGGDSFGGFGGGSCGGGGASGGW